MHIYPKKFKAYSVEGVNCFPIYGHAGSLCSAFMAFIYDGNPKDFNGQTLKMDEQVYGDYDGKYIGIKFYASDPIFTIDAKVDEAEKKLDEWRPQG